MVSKELQEGLHEVGQPLDYKADWLWMGLPQLEEGCTLPKACPSQLALSLTNATVLTVS